MPENMQQIISAYNSTHGRTNEKKRKPTHQPNKSIPVLPSRVFGKKDFGADVGDEANSTDASEGDSGGGGKDGRWQGRHGC